MVKRHRLTDEQWELVKPLIPHKVARTGRPPKDPRLMLDGIFWILIAGTPWRDLHECFGPWQTVYDHFSRWRREGIFAEVVEALQVKLDQRGLINWELWNVDGASVRAARAAAGADKKVSTATPTSPPTTRWAAAAAGLARNSTWSAMAGALRLPSKSRLGKCMKAPVPSRSSGRPSPA
jgi:transposase